MTAAPVPRWRRVLRPVIGTVSVLAITAAIAVTLRGQDWSVLATMAEPTALALLAGAFAVNAVGLWLAMLAWRALVTGLGSTVPVWPAARIYFVGILAKFVPGRVWMLLANIRMGRAAGVSPGRMAAAYVLGIPINTLSGVAVGLIAAPAVLGARGAWLILAVLPLLAFAVRPDLVNQLAAGVARLLRRSPPETRTSDRGIRLSIAGQSISWLVAGIHLWLLAIAAGAPPLRSLPLCLGVFALAAVGAGFVVVVPDGIGVREAMLIAALAPVLPLPAAGAVALVSRLVCTLSEISVAAVALLAAELIRRRDRLPADAQADAQAGQPPTGPPAEADTPAAPVKADTPAAPAETEAQADRRAPAGMTAATGSGGAGGVPCSSDR